MSAAELSEDELDVLAERLATMPTWRREALMRVAAQPDGAAQLRRAGLTRPATGAALGDVPVDRAGLVQGLRRTPAGRAALRARGLR